MDGAVDVGTEKVENVSYAVDGAVCELAGLKIFFDGKDYGHENVGRDVFLGHDIDTVCDEDTVGAVRDQAGGFLLDCLHNV